MNHCNEVYKYVGDFIYIIKKKLVRFYVGLGRIDLFQFRTMLKRN